MALCQCEYSSPLGRMILCADTNTQSLCGAWLDGQRHIPTWLNDCTIADTSNQLFASAIQWLDEYFYRPEILVASGEAPHLPPRLNPITGTSFQRAVWSQMQRIPFGECRTYGDIAASLHTSPRAVGSAAGKNPLLIFVPCHRVVGANNSLTGFAAGLSTKEWLLHHEKSARDMWRSTHNI